MIVSNTVKPVILYIFREFYVTLFLLFGVSIVVFGVLYSAPGDPLAAVFGGQILTEEQRDEIRKSMGISATWYGQYWSWLTKLLQGDFGTSLRSGQPVLGEVMKLAANTFYLTFGAMFLSLSIAVPIATYLAKRGTDRLGWGLMMFAYTTSAVPLFWSAYIMIYVFTHYFNTLPIGLANSDSVNVAQILLPIVMLGLGSGIISETVRFLRDEISRVFAEDYVRTARAKGVSVWKHAITEALIIPVSEMIASKIPFVIGGAIIVEQIFNWPGIGRMAWQAAQDRDYPVIMCITLVTAVIVRGTGLFHKTLYVIVNPRASQEHKPN
ncbi:MAG: ABC transporter permease [Gammaproteobacteria bacterium]|nr:ABC transporter permease [Gammaproteobacteria bacterium]